MKHYRKNKDLKIGDKITTKYYPEEFSIVREIEDIYKFDTCESGYKIRVKNLICKCCNQIIGTVIPVDIDSNWAKPI